jgi:hypothetical protein
MAPEVAGLCRRGAGGVMRRLLRRAVDWCLEFVFIALLLQLHVELQRIVCSQASPVLPSDESPDK